MADAKGAALVTGAARRIGRALALALAREGHDVAVHYGKSAAEAEAVADEIRALGRRCALIRADLAREADVASVVPAARSALGPLRVLVNSASTFETDDIFTMTRESWDRHIEANLRAPVKLIQDFAAAADTQADNLVVNILDQRVLKLTPQFFSYTAAKSALFILTKTLAQALGPRNIRVNAIGPGPTMRNVRQSEADFLRQTEATVLGRGATTDDLAGALRYLLGARAVTGQMIAVDGGQHLIWQTPDVLVGE
ncbi:MAG: SDR family oxidoreductase [Parvularculaceae bacterium]|jgi:NAD(P)-dependent dehydrogenase (short-subunit alcohol dehydrogenase family)|nr:SDR family oxidoreductase [Parvularculaceae bacterium]